MLKILGVLAAATVAAVTITVVPALGAPGVSGTPLPDGNACANPALATKSTGWSTRSGGTGSRVAVTDHVAAHFARQTVSKAPAVVVALPQVAVHPGERWTFAADSRIDPGGSVKVTVEWLDPTSASLGRADGAAVSMGTTWRQALVTATAHAGAATAVVTETAAVKTGTAWLSTACIFARSTTGTPAPTGHPTATPTPSPTAGPTPTPTPTPGGSDDGTQAAALLHWGLPVDGDEFNGAGLDTAKWGVYEGAGNGGKGKRAASQIAVGGGLLTISGTSNGTTGGMAFHDSYVHGRWETRMRVPQGDTRYHPVLILWPTADDWPSGGEVDYAETTTASSNVEFFLHYSSSNQQTSAAKSIDLTQWHNYAVDWTSSGIRGYIDGVLWFTDTNASHMPPRKMQQTIQLDWFPSGSGSTKPSSMQVDWTRYYAP